MTPNVPPKRGLVSFDDSTVTVPGLVALQSSILTRIGMRKSQMENSRDDHGSMLYILTMMAFIAERIDKETIDSLCM